MTDKPLLGQIEIFAFDYAPLGWAICSGQMQRIDQNTALFALLGTTYGGDGRITFALPDLRGRVALGSGPGHARGQLTGVEQHALTIEEMPLHSHALTADPTTPATSNGGVPGNTTVLGNATGVTTNPDGSFLVEMYSNEKPNGTLAPQAVGGTGRSQVHENRMPCVALNFCIATSGIYPSAN